MSALFVFLVPVIDNCELPYELREPSSGLQEQKSSELPSYLFFSRDKDLESSLIRCSFSKRVVGYRPGPVEFLNHGFLARFIAPSTTFRLHLTPGRPAKIKTTKDNKCRWGCGVKRQPLCTVCGMQINAATTGISVAIPQKTRNSFSPLWPWHTLRDSFSYQSDTRSSPFIAGLVSIARTWKQCINWRTSWKQGSILFSYKEKGIWQGNEWSWKMK